MNPLRCILLLQFATLAFGQTAHQANQPDALVRSLYTQVIAHRPNGSLDPAQIKSVAPYLSKALLHKIDLAQACSADWDRHNPEPHLKARLASDYGLFSGEYYLFSNEKQPQKFNIDSTGPMKDGSVRVYVTLADAKPPWPSNDWRVAPILVLEDGHLAVDDVIYLDDAIWDNEADRRNTMLSQYLAAGCNGPHWIGTNLPSQPEALVTSLYQQVVARAPGGIPEGTDWKVFAPYMSKTLLHRIDLALACDDDWFRQNRGQMVKAPFGWSESGLFSGANEETSPHAFQIVRTQTDNKGLIHVYLKLTWGDPHAKPFNWPVAAILTRENGRLVLEEVVYLKDEATNVTADYRLSQVLSSGCRGTHWIGP
jgi:hypothetical protein